ncbi:MAG: DUF3833 family protein [Alphaproteobacteria bacterium]|nr:DUF3833 family protein [Alphaproteobacteria bacterium]
MTRIRWVLLGFALALIALAVHPRPAAEDYAERTPELDLRRYMNGAFEGWGVLTDYRGTAEPRFHIRMQAGWRGDEGELAEDFTFNDGHTDRRVWKLRFSDAHHFTATANDVIGLARGEQYGDTAHLRYVLRLPVLGGMHDVDMDYWLYAVDAHTLVNRVEMRKFGFTLGELAVVFRKP